MAAGQSDKLKVGAIIQARMKSERLPGKILMPLPFPKGKPLLWWIVNSVRQSKKIDKIVLASSVNKENDPLVTFCNENSLTLFRGKEEDVLSRFIQVSRQHEFDIVVRLTGDNPIVDTSLLDSIVLHHITSRNDYTKTEGLPLGMNFEIVSTSALYQIENRSLSNEDTEHVTLYLRNSAEFRKEEIRLFEGEGLDAMRLTIDYHSDYAMMSMLLNLLKDDELPTLDTIRKIRSHSPWLFAINDSNLQRQPLLKMHGTA